MKTFSLTRSLTKNQVANLLKEENLLRFNREISDKHVNKLRKEIEKRGFVSVPMIVRRTWITPVGNGHNQLAIADGQHRLSAAVGLMDKGQRIDVVQVDVKNVDDLIELVTSLNSTSKGWQLGDYLSCFVSFNKFHYVKFNNWVEATKLAPDTLILACESTKSEFKSGDLVIKSGNRTKNIVKFAARLKKWVKAASAAHCLNGVVKFLVTNHDLLGKGGLCTSEQLFERLAAPTLVIESNREAVQSQMLRIASLSSVEFARKINSKEAI